MDAVSVWVEHLREQAVDAVSVWVDYLRERAVEAQQGAEMASMYARFARGLDGERIARTRGPRAQRAAHRAGIIAREAYRQWSAAVEAASYAKRGRMAGNATTYSGMGQCLMALERAEP